MYTNLAKFPEQFRGTYYLKNEDRSCWAVDGGNYDLDERIIWFKPEQFRSLCFWLGAEGDK